MGVRVSLSLAIVWTQFLSRCIDHRQGVAEGGQAGNMRRGGAVRVVMDTGGRLERIAYFLCMWTGNRKAGGPWRALQREKEKELEWVGFCPCSLALCSQPCSCAR